MALGGIWELFFPSVTTFDLWNGIPAELFQIPKDDAVKVLHSICQQIWKTQPRPQDWKRSVLISIPKKGNAKESSNYHTFALISNASKVMLNIFQARLQQYVNWELPDIQAEFRKGRGTRDQIANIHWITEKEREFQENIYFCFIEYGQSLWYVDHNNCGKFLKRWEYQTTWPTSWEICMQVKKQQLEPDMEQWTGSKLGKDYVRALYHHPAYLTYIQSTSCKMLGWLKHKVESRLPGEISITSYMQMTPPYGRKWRGSKEPLDEKER